MEVGIACVAFTDISAKSCGRMSTFSFVSLPFAVGEDVSCVVSSGLPTSLWLPSLLKIPPPAREGDVAAEVALAEEDFADDDGGGGAVGAGEVNLRVDTGARRSADCEGACWASDGASSSTMAMGTRRRRGEGVARAGGVGWDARTSVGAL